MLHALGADVQVIFLIPFATTDDYNSGPFTTSESTRAEKGMSIRCPSKIREL